MPFDSGRASHWQDAENHRRDGDSWRWISEKIPFEYVVRRQGARLPVSIYQPCAIRGDAATELSPELYESWGRVLGRQLPPRTKFVVGGDVRASTPRFLAALVDGLCQAGLDVVNLGLLPTPMIYYARHRLAPAAVPSSPVRTIRRARTG